MKRLLVFTISLLLVFSFAGCEPKQGQDRKSNELALGSKTEVEKKDPFTIKGKPVKEIEEELKQTHMFQTAAPKVGDKIAIITTNQGEIKVKLFPEKTPETVKNFEELAKEGKYNGTIFHRVIENFMIQGGDFTNHDGTGGHSYKGPGTNIDDEFDPELKNIRGALSMANAGPNTNGSQFFIVRVKETDWLDGKHSVFGQVYEGLDTVDKIAVTEVGFRDKPIQDQVIEKIEITTFE